MSKELENLHRKCADALDSIAGLFLYDTRLTLICRHVGGQLDDADVLVSDDTFDGMRSVIDRFEAKENGGGK